MIKTVHFLITVVLALILSIVLPWWAVMLAALLTGLVLPLKGIAAFVVPFAAGGLFWLIYAFWLGQANDFTLSRKIATLLPLSGNAYLLLLVTGVIGGLAASLAGLSGSLLRQWNASNT
ncbi:hypothetical protein [Croceiramulus getboli]|nr:hypothetical protein P8624_11380 [Flavobacteriaceae bacterium YJPT1-3]